ncbi:TetR/AcrR family transcriptional regulator [Acrocarpospora catenulata]|uniref:TetR/AcrR family transcriptional regulator n=1 Tax=Acrocarpospora catenulata TaxID=2836182 RepID=UPI001BDA87DF|nr:TetR/AcrR family transcriptional regulator [Acrocarpospora catenulata]
MSNESKGRRVVDRRNREAEVLQAAVEVFYAKGYSAASVQDVADRVGVLKGSLYHYISSKEDLLFRIFAESHEQAVQIMEGITARDLPPRKRLEAFLTEIIHWYLNNVERVSLYFNEWRYLTGDNAATVRKHRRVFSDYLRDTLTDGAAELRPGTDVRLATFYMLGAVNNIPVWYRKTGPYSAARVASEFVSMSTFLAFTEN